MLYVSKLTYPLVPWCCWLGDTKASSFEDFSVGKPDLTWSNCGKVGQLNKN